MASGFFALLDDIASLLDDVSVMTKVAVKKTAGVLGDDLALNAQQVAGVRADRELQVVWAVARGSFLNKLVLVPAALAISALAPWAVVPLLMVGGAYLCFEGAQKLAHRLFQVPSQEAAQHQALVQALDDPQVDVLALEQRKIRGAVRTDFILSAEIIVIALGTVADSPFISRVSVLAAVAVLMTVGVYGLVAAIVKLDDAGLHLSRSGAAFLRALGRALVLVAPWLMRALSVAGTAAMFLVGGSILLHGVPVVRDAVEGVLAGMQGMAASLAGLGADAVTGLLAGGVLVAVVQLARRLFPRRAAP